MYVTVSFRLLVLIYTVIKLLGKKDTATNYELQPEGLDITNMSFNQPNLKNKMRYNNFVGAVAHKGISIPDKCFLMYMYHNIVAQ